MSAGMIRRVEVETNDYGATWLISTWVTDGFLSRPHHFSWSRATQLVERIGEGTEVNISGSSVGEVIEVLRSKAPEL